MKRRARICTTAALALSLTACASSAFLRPPTLPAVTPIEKAMDCPQIDLSIDRADTVRWLIRDDGGKLETSSQRIARYAGNVVIVPLSVVARQPLFIGDNGHAVLNAADARISELLQLKRARACVPRATALPALDEFSLLRELESIHAQIDARSGDEARLFKERTRLLDGLRIVPGTTAVAPSEDEKTATTP